MIIVAHGTNEDTKKEGKDKFFNELQQQIDGNG